MAVFILTDDTGALVTEDRWRGDEDLFRRGLEVGDAEARWRCGRGIVPAGGGRVGDREEDNKGERPERGAK